MKRYAIALLSVYCLFILAGGAGAQNLTGKVFGTVTDASGAEIPNVKITLTSPAELQPLTATTSGGGAYQFPGLPIGTYAVKFEAAGYRTAVHEGIVIDAGFNAEINIKLDVAAVQQTVEVTSAAPVIDTQSTAIDTHFDQVSLQDLPTGRDQSSMIRQTPNALMSNDVGGSTNGTTGSGVAHGSNSSQGKFYYDNVPLGTPAGGQDMWVDYDSIQEESMGLGGADASQQTSGIQINMTGKQGGNLVHGSVHWAFEDENFESTNLDPTQRTNAALSGASAGNPLKRFSDWGLEFGGPIKKDRLWYWADWTRQVLTLGADKLWEPTTACAPVEANPLTYDYSTIRSCTVPIPLALQHAAYKINWATFHNNTFTFENRYDVKQQQLFGYTPNRPLLATQVLASLVGPGLSYGPRFWDAGWPALWKFDDQQILSDRWVVDAFYSHFNKSNQQLLHSPSLESVMPWYEQSTQTYNQSYLYSIASQPINEVSGTSSYFLPGRWGGNQTFKAGYIFDRYENFEQEYYGGDGELIYSSGTAKPFSVPLAVNFYQPSLIDAFLYQNSWYVQDTFVHKRTTFNLGVRFDRQNDLERPENIPASPYEGQITATGIPFNLMPAIAYPGAHSIPWNVFAPRLGATYDLTGNGKTVLKASYDEYFDQRTPGQLSDTYDVTGVASIQGTTPNFVQYPWNGAQSNGAVTMSSVNITGPPRSFGGNYNPANPLQTTTPNTVDPNIKDPRTHEVIGGINREIANGFALDVSYIYRRYSDFVYKELNGITSANYFPCQTSLTAAGTCTYPNASGTGTTTISVAATPCASGAQCAPVTYYVPNITVPAAYTYTNEPNYSQRYSGLEVVALKRLSHGWMIDASYTYQTTTQHFGPGSYVDPTNIAQENNQIYAPASAGSGSIISVPSATSANWIIRGNGEYRLPWHGIQFSAFMNLHEGYPIENEINVATRPNSAGSVAVLEGAPGSLRFPTFLQIDARVAKNFKVREGKQIETALDSYNLTNSNFVIAQQPIQNSSTANYLGIVQGPRVQRVTVRFVF